MSNDQIPNVPSPCPLSVGGPDSDHVGFKEPMSWMYDSKKITMEECDAPKKYKAMVPLPAYLTDLIFQFGAWAPAVLKKEWLVALLRQLKQTTSTTVTDHDDEVDWTHPDFRDVCQDPHPKATKDQLLAHLAAWCKAMDISDTDDWGPIGTSIEPLPLQAIFMVIIYRAQERVDEVCRAGGLVNAPHVGQAMATALASKGKFDHELLKAFIWKSLHVFGRDQKDTKGTRHRFHAALTRMVFLFARRCKEQVPGKRKVAAWLASFRSNDLHVKVPAYARRAHNEASSDEDWYSIDVNPLIQVMRSLIFNDIELAVYESDHTDDNEP